MALLLATGGCSRPVAIDDPVPPEPVVGVCEAVMAALPDTVLDQQRRDVQAGRFAAAWGEPTLTLRCGVAQPPPTTDCIVVNGVGWTPSEATGGAIFTTFGRAAYVQVAVPSAYAPEANALAVFSAAVSAHDPVQQDCREPSPPR